MSDRFVRCRHCGTRQRVRVTGTVTVHHRPNPEWRPEDRGRWGVVRPTEVCPGSATTAGLHAELVVRRRERRVCPGCGRMVTLTASGALRAHACEARPRHGEPPPGATTGRTAPRAGSVPAPRAIRVRGED